MKQANLPNGQKIMFDPSTPDEIIKKIVKKIVKDDKQWTDSQVKTLVREMTETQGKLELQRSNVDHFGPAIDKQTKGTQDFIKKMMDAQSKTINGISTGKIEASLGETVKQLSVLSSKISTMITKNDENTAGLMKAIMANTEALNKLVEATKAPKTVVRNKAGDIQKIK